MEQGPCRGVAWVQLWLRGLAWTGPSAGALLRLLRPAVLFGLATSCRLLSSSLRVAAALAVEGVALELLVAQPPLRLSAALPPGVEQV